MPNYHFAFCTICSVDGETFTLRPCSSPDHAEQLSASVGEYLGRLDDEHWHEVAKDGLPADHRKGDSFFIRTGDGTHLGLFASRWWVMEGDADSRPYAREVDETVTHWAEVVWPDAPPARR